MFRRALKVMMIAAGLALLTQADRALPDYLVGTYQRYSRAIQASDVPMNSLERFVFSLIVANGHSCESSKAMSTLESNPL